MSCTCEHDPRWQGNAFRTREDMQRAIVALCAPLEAHRSAGGARIRLHGPGASHPASVQELEGFARMSWGLAPLTAGGGSYAAAARVREGLINGCDPQHPEYWGTPVDRDQRFVEAAALAAAIVVSPDTFWTPLSRRQRERLTAWLATIDTREVHDNNWRFFRILIGLTLARHGAPLGRRRIAEDLDRIDAFYLGDGWYADGSNRAADYYTAFAMHFYGLLCAPLLREVDRRRSDALVERAVAFVGQFVHWFAADGAAIPYGRSLTYRFAQAAFWSALAFAGVEAAPWGWGVIKGIVLRHLRWWARQPIATEGLLSIGYAYPNQMLADRYSSPCSPYWALKTFLPAALSTDAAFWRAEEQPLPALDPVVAQPQSGMVLCRDRDHLFALAAAPRVPACARHGAAQYGKFCYSASFGFSVPAASHSLSSGAHDSALALSEAGDGHYRSRGESDAVDVSAARIISHWTAWPDTRVTTWLVPMPPWHVRVHRVRTGRPLTAAEGGFAVGLGADEAAARVWSSPGLPEAFPAGFPAADGTWIGARAEHGISVIADLFGTRRGEIVRSDPNTNVLFPRAVIPTLHATLQPGEHWLACAVAAATAEDAAARFWAARPTCRRTASGFEIRDARGRVVLAESVFDAGGL